ncbi:complement component receptor 1-like protein isoform X2 [Mixophyes fleayi]|uniref:complement component receptor 1-like protein isoform X2 n=1 Tax=Mixophyes fleayi TaxID=3061075 RepID=UPI003F4DA2DD
MDFFYPVKEEYHFQDAVKYECNGPNAVIEFDSSVFCMEDGEWSSGHPDCIEVNCDSPNISNSRKLSGFVGPYTLNSMVRLECVEGFIMNGSSSIVCNIDSEWMPSPPICERGFCPVPKLLNGNIKKTTQGYGVGVSIQLECNSRYFLRGKNKVKCEKDFQWHPEIPICEKREFCPVPIFLNGIIKRNKQEYRVGESIELECNSDYTLKGKKKVTCEKDFQWSSEIPICEKKYHLLLNLDGVQDQTECNIYLEDNSNLFSY